ncbi:hypothetical protein BDV95DRAFT_175321 [Massariosphaeria phaeospora]|uniref:Uncharacterized protein n=1 Tax=Massariosphaeria phaeospora TaxID=100035 RepID=A0A7C8I5I4_9PLEO|nr:hypothetical protein BDV95DRAFT_175321 [Massariosphaeria phaeospora]
MNPFLLFKLSLWTLCYPINRSSETRRSNGLPYKSVNLWSHMHLARVRWRLWLHVLGLGGMQYKVIEWFCRC